MTPQEHAAQREVIVAKAMQQVVRELRLVDVVDYIAFIRLEHFACLADIVDSAAELYFMPGTLKLGHGAEAQMSWSGSPRIVLDLELSPVGAKVYFQLFMTALDAGIEINYVSFDRSHDDPQVNTDYLERALAGSRFNAREPVGLR